MSHSVERDYRDTLHLPKTSFPMKAELPKREPERVQWWKAEQTYNRRLAANAGSDPWVLHDGPPYANGELHMGHFLNMVVKDIFVKIALLDGRRATFVPGWDMHGLPIELDTLKHLKIRDFHAVDPLELRAHCKERALYWLDRQRSVRERMGCFGDFEHPYRTIDPSFEATIVNALADLAEQHQLYRGLRSTLWCIHDETALAEAEIEYEPKMSPSIYVRFPANEEQRAALLTAFGVDQGVPGRASVLTWTTTPWTLPANVAIALREDATYGLYAVGEELLVVATLLAPAALGEDFRSARLLARVQGGTLDGLRVRHPFLDRDSAIVLAEYVDLETGTGAVHTAPGHGADDFETGVKYDLPILNPVDATGHFTAEAGPYAGMQIFEANARIVADLAQNGTLLRALEYQHSYPHCWRCHNPVIFRATAQWFLAMDQNRLRARAIDAARDVTYSPAWGEERLVQMLEHHPEWCLSRQRTWGTPIPALRCTACDEPFLDARVARLTAERFAQDGADSWWRDPVESFVPEGVLCPACGGGAFEKMRDIVDIWFESGVTHLAVLGHDGLPWPADVVLEGGDQYRGWFRSSIVTAVAIRGRAPYKHIVKNGWVNDEQGRPMSKSRGTGADAGDAMAKWGADVLRLWAASVEFVDDVRFGSHVVEQVGNVYRNMRNRIRFMLGNLDDFRPEMAVAREQMLPLDALACEVTDAWIAGVYGKLKAFALHDAYVAFVAFQGSDLSGFYLDALKDRLYTSAADSRQRRSAQSAIWYILERFLVVLAPILSFTAEEAWQALAQPLRGTRAGVFDCSFDVRSVPQEAGAARHAELWELLKELRGRIAAGGEARDFEAQVRVRASDDLYESLHALGDDLRLALVVSQVHLERDAGLNGRPSAGDRVELTISRADGQKCRRCWKYQALGSDAEHPSLCADCAAVVRGADLAARSERPAT